MISARRSIGLNVGQHEPYEQLSLTLALISALCTGRLLSLAMGESEWEGTPERFVQVEIQAPDRQDARQFAAALAASLRQDAVAVLFPAADAWELVRPDGSESPGGTVSDFPPLELV